MAEILTELVQEWIWGLEGKRLMRWGDGDGRFSRPIRWLVTLLDETVLPLELVNGSKTIQSDRISQGHRVLHPEPVTIAKANDYVTALKSAYVTVDPEERENLIKEQVKAVAESLSGYTVIYPDLLAEVTNLVEYPSTVVGKLQPAFDRRVQRVARAGVDQDGVRLLADDVVQRVDLRLRRGLDVLDVRSTRPASGGLVAANCGAAQHLLAPVVADEIVGEINLINFVGGDD